MEKNRDKHIGLSNILENLLFPPGKYNMNQLINLTPFFQGKLTFDNYKALMSKTIDMPDEERLWWVIKAEYGEVDSKVLLVVLMMQLVGKERREMGGYNEASRNISAHSQSGTESPRNRNSNRALYISNQQILNLNFIKEHFISFLRLLPNQPPNNEDPFLTAQQLQPLSVLFKVDRKKPFASYLPIFNNNVQKLRASTISEHLVPRIVISETCTFLSILELLSLEASNYSVIIKEEMQCRGKDLKMIGCDDSQIYIDSSVRSLYIVSCSNCNIYVAACERIAFIDKCSKISLTIASNCMRVCNTVDSNIYFYGSSPITLTGDNRALMIGPSNCNSVELKSHLKAANIPIKKQFISQFSNVLCRSQTSNFEKMKPIDYDLLVLPLKQEEKTQKGSNEQTNLNLLAPPEYIEELENRNKYYKSFKQKIAKSNLSPEMINHLQSACQGHFKDWLINKGYNKNLIDLVKMIDKK